MKKQIIIAAAVALGMATSAAAESQPSDFTRVEDGANILSEFYRTGPVYSSNFGCSDFPEVPSYNTEYDEQDYFINAGKNAVIVFNYVGFMEEFDVNAYTKENAECKKIYLSIDEYKTQLARAQPKADLGRVENEERDTTPVWLYEKDCEDGTGKIAQTTNQHLLGCWHIKNNMVVVEWHTRMVLLEPFERLPKGKYFSVFEPPARPASSYLNRPTLPRHVRD